MTSSFHESFEQENIPLPSERSTGLVFAAVAVFAAVLLRHSPVPLLAALTVSAVFVLLAVFAPRALGPLNRLWFRFALLLNRVVSPVVMLILFLVTIVPFGLVMQLRRDPLTRRRKPDGQSYWRERSPPTAEHSMRNQF